MAHKKGAAYWRAQSRAMFPGWSRAQRARWVLSKLRVESGTYRFPVGAKAMPANPGAPDFLRVLPPGQHLTVVPDRRDHIVAVARFARRIIQGGR